MSKPKHFRWLIGALFAVNLLGCISDAPRDNPLESNPSGIEPGNSAITGRVQNYYRTRDVEGAILMLAPGLLTTRTDSSGSFAFFNLPEQAFTLTCSAAGYASESREIRLGKEETIEANFELDSLPFFSSIRLVTERHSRVLMPDSLLLGIAALAEDMDRTEDVDLVWFEIPYLNFIDTLQAELPAIPNLFSGRYTPAQLGLNALDPLEGKPFIFYIKNFQGNIVQSDSVYLSRLIPYVPEPRFPNGDIIASGFFFRWDNVAIPFSFNYEIDLRQRFGFNSFQLVDRITDIPPDSLKRRYEQLLEPGEDFRWRLYIVDEFGNRRSSPVKPFSTAPAGAVDAHPVAEGRYDH